MLIDKTILKDCKKGHAKLAMAQINYKKAYDFVPHSWIIDCMAMTGITDDVINFLQKSMDQWKLSLTVNGEDLGDVEVRRRIFQGDSLSPLLFVVGMMTRSLILRNVNASYDWGGKEYKLNHLLFMKNCEVSGIGKRNQ